LKLVRFISLVTGLERREGGEKTACRRVLEGERKTDLWGVGAGPEWNRAHLTLFSYRETMREGCPRKDGFQDSV